MTHRNFKGIRKYVLDKIHTFEALEAIILELRADPEWWKYENEISALAESYLSGAFDKTDREFRRRQCIEAYIRNGSFYLCSKEKFDKARKITRRQVEKDIAWNEGLRRKAEEEKERKSIKESLKEPIQRSESKTPVPVATADITIDRTISYMNYEISVNPGKIEVFGPWSPETRMILHYVSLKLLEFSENLTLDQKKLYEKKKEIEKYSEDMELYKIAQPEVFESLALRFVIDPSDLRRRFAVRDKYTNKQIREIALSIPGIYFRGKGRLYYDKQHRRFCNVELACGLGDVVAVETKKKERHTGEPKILIGFKFYTPLSMTIVANILHTKPIKALDTFHRLLPARQNIYSAVMLKATDPCRFSELELLKLAGIEDTNPIRARQSLANHLDKLKENGLIKKWEKCKNKKSYLYRIWEKD